MTSSFFKKFRFQSVFLFTMKRKAGIFKFLWFKERSRKLRLRDGLVWAVGLTIEIKLWEHVAGMVRQGQAPSCARMGHMLKNSTQVRADVTDMVLF